MASQQAWNDFEKLVSLVGVANSTLDGVLAANLNELNSLFIAITAVPSRVAEVAALADTHPVNTAASLTNAVGTLLSLRNWLVANGYMS